MAFPSVKSVDILKEGFVLFVYITKYGSNALAMLGNKDKWPPAIGYLNPYIGRFKLPDSDLGWQMVYTLSPIGKMGYSSGGTSR